MLTGPQAPAHPTLAKGPGGMGLAAAKGMRLQGQRCPLTWTGPAWTPAGRRRSKAQTPKGTFHNSLSHSDASNSDGLKSASSCSPTSD